MIFENSQGQRWFGLHCYPGVAEYNDQDGMFRIYLNSDTIKKMDKSFEAKPLFVEHVESVEDDIDKLRNDADGWVVRSFYNVADGKHWAEFITTSKRAEKAIANGFRLSNAFMPESFSNGGHWNGVQYDKEITSGTYEHLALVSVPRYEESIVLSPEEFKEYNDRKLSELKSLQNSKGKNHMAFTFFTKKKIENSKDYSDVHVLLPKSGKEYSIKEVIEAMDDVEVGRGKPRLVNSKDLVEFDGEKLTVEALVKRLENALGDEEEAKKQKRPDTEDTEGEAVFTNEDEDDDDMDDIFENEDDEEDDKEEAAKAKKKNKGKMKNKSKVKNDLMKPEDFQRRIQKIVSAEMLRNARDMHDKFENSRDRDSEMEIIESPTQKGKRLFGS